LKFKTVMIEGCDLKIIKLVAGCNMFNVAHTLLEIATDCEHIKAPQK
jgi:hypothetical protein